jgi:hypothetical protein
MQMYLMDIETAAEIINTEIIFLVLGTKGKT